MCTVVKCQLQRSPLYLNLVHPVLPVLSHRMSAQLLSRLVNACVLMSFP